MVRDGLANFVDRLRESGFDPRRVGGDAWESRCPAHRSADHVLSITRNEHNHLMLECRGAQKCAFSRIIASLGWTNEHVYQETPDWLIGRLRRAPIQPSSFRSGNADISASAPDVPNGPELEDEGSTYASDVGKDSELMGEASASASDLVNGAGSDDPVGAIYTEAGAGVPDDVEPELKGEAVGPKTSLQVLLRLASDARFFRSADGQLFGQVPLGSRHEIYGLRSRAFRDWLIGAYLADSGEIPPQLTVRRVLAALEAKARFEEGTPSVFIRVGHDGWGIGSSYYLDLGDASGRAVKIGPEGWMVVDRPAVHFRRPEGLLALPTPSRQGSIELLRTYVNLSDRDFRLMIAWMAAALRPVGPYPILALYGEQAAAKSTLAKVVRLLIDPQAAPLLAIPRGVRNLMVTAHNGWLLAYDNISVINNAVSDGLCMVSTGGAYAGRTLFSNDERSVIRVERPAILSGIEEFVRRGDLSDRTVYLNLASIDDANRRREDEFWAAFQRDQPAILGGLLDAIAGGLRVLPAITLEKLPRMADFAAFGEAVGRSLGWRAGTFLADYYDNRRESTATQLEDSPVAEVLLRIAPDLGIWTGTASELLAMLNDAVGRRMSSSSRWPKSPWFLSNEIRRIAPQLRMNGISITTERNREKRLFTLKSTIFAQRVRHT